jgi:hypothetical protein
MSALVPSPDDAPVYTRGQLRSAVQDLLADALGVISEELARPALLTQAQLAEQLQVSDRTVFALRRDGMPHLMIGDSPRFELPACLAWLRARTPK